MKRTKGKNEVVQDVFTNVLGKIWEDEGQNVRSIGFFPNELKKLLNKGGYKSPTTIIKKWKDKGILEVEENRLTKLKTIRTGEKVRLNILIQKNYLVDTDEEKVNDEKVSRGKAEQQKINDTLQDILSEDAC